MKICLISTSFPRNQTDDAGIFIARLAEALAKQNIGGTILFPHAEGAETKEYFSQWKLERVKYGIFSRGRLAYGSGIMPNLKANPLLLLQVPGFLLCLSLRAVICCKQVDLIHSHWLGSAIPGLIANILKGKPLIVTIRGVDLKLLGLPIVGTLMRWLLSKRAQITTVSDHFKQKLQSYFPNKQIHLIPNGVTRISNDPNALSKVQEKYSVSGLSYSIFASRVIALKRLEILVDLLAMLKDRSQYLLICGSLDDEPYLKQLKQHISSLGMESRVKFLGPTSPEDFLQLLTAAKLYWSASEYEGRPNSVLEALAHGIPVVASNISGHTALVRDGYNGLIFDPQDIDKVADKVSQLLNDADLIRNMGEKAIESVSNLSWEKCAANYIELYHKSLNSQA